MSTAHVAASEEDARLAAWVPAAGSADADLISELDIIVPRARDLVRNNPLASSARQTFSDNIIGHQLRLSSQPRYRLLGWNKDKASEWANKTEDEFATWAETTECDVSRTQTLLGLTIQALTGALVNGDALAIVMWQPRRDRLWSTRLQMVEADRLQTPPWLLHDKTVRGGVKIDKNGAPLGYWILRSHPGDQLAGLVNPDAFRWTYVRAFTPHGRRRVIHLYDKERAGQNRGKSVFTAVMREFKMAGEYLGSELHAAVVNALVAAFLESDLDQNTVSELFGADAQQATDYWRSVSDKWHRKKMESGLIQTLPVGTRLSSHNTTRPNVAFDGFMSSVMRHMAAGLNMPYELLVKDFSQTNYSSARAALLEAWRYFNSKRRWLKEHWLDPIYDAWMEEAINIGRIDAPDFYENRYAYTNARWIMSGRGFVDPVKEAKGSELKMGIGISTQQEECAEQGRDYQDVQDQRIRELKEATEKAKDAGLPLEMAYYVAGFVPSPVQVDMADTEETENTQQEAANA